MSARLSVRQGGTIWLLLSALVVGLDQLTKAIVLNVLQPYIPQPVIPGLLNWTLAFNDGAAFSFLAGEAGWRVVPVDDARLLADAAAGTEPYAAPLADTAVGGLFADEERSRWVDVEWIAPGVLLGLAVLGAAVRATTRRGGRA